MTFERVMPFGTLSVTFGEETIGFSLVVDGVRYETISELPRVDELSFNDTLKLYTQNPELIDFYATKTEQIISLGFSRNNGECEDIRIVEFRIPFSGETTPSVNVSEQSADESSSLDKRPIKNSTSHESREEKSPNAYARRTLLTWLARKRNSLNITHSHFLIDINKSFGRKCDNTAAIKRAIKALNTTISTATEVRDQLEEVLTQDNSV